MTMYLPNHFSSKDVSTARKVVEQHPLASLISLDDEGFPFVSHIPIHWDESGADPAQTDHFCLLGHLANGNPHVKHLAARAEVLVTFLGPNAYLSPSVYPDKQRVPTCNYVALHCKAELEVITDPTAKDALLKRLIADHEPAYAQQWRDLPESYTSKMLSAITGYRLNVKSWQLKLKLNQHRPEAQATTLAQYQGGGPREQELARWMKKDA